MKWSIKHLPKNTQEELNYLRDLIIQLKYCDLIILFGSYARGNYVLWDEKIEFGVHTSYQSDLDILVVVSRGSIKYVADRLRSKVGPKYHEAFKHRRHAPPRFIVEYGEALNNELKQGQPFFTEIVRDGIKMHDAKTIKLPKPCQLPMQEIREFAVKAFQNCYSHANNFMKHTYIDMQDEEYVAGSYQLHQACEKYYNTISLVFSNYKPKGHRLDELDAMAKSYSREILSVFPLNTVFEKNCFDLLCRAYIEARYNFDFVITKEELTYLIERAEILKELTFRVCNEKIAEYDDLISQQENEEK